jgi:hypothetical protein
MSDLFFEINRNELFSVFSFSLLVNPSQANIEKNYFSIYLLQAFRANDRVLSAFPLFFHLHSPSSFP